MNVLLGFAFCLPLALSATTIDISANNENDNDFVNIETFEDYGGDIVPYVSDPYVEDDISNDVVEEITVNQTIVDNTEVLNKMDILDNRLTLLNNNFNSVLSSGISSDDSLINCYFLNNIIRNIVLYIRVTHIRNNISTIVLKSFYVDKIIIIFIISRNINSSGRQNQR